MKIYSVFHVALIKPADSETLLQMKSPEINKESQDTEFKVKKILEKQEISSQLYFLIK